MTYKLFTGNSNIKLVHEICTKLKYGPKERADITTFSDGEIRVEIVNSVRNTDVFVIQSTCVPVNDTLMELVLMVDALKRSAVNKIYAVIPYYGYARQEKRPGYSRVPISARVVADILESVGVNHLITVDLHAIQIQGFFSIPVDNISATQLFVADIYKQWINENPIIVSPDVGGVARARNVAKHLDMDLAIVDKRRPRPNVAEIMNIIGDVADKTCIIIDDMVDTAHTLGKAADALVTIGGARRVVAYATHGVLSGKAKENLENSQLEQLVVTNTIPLRGDILLGKKVRQLSIAGILAETIERIDRGISVGAILD